MDPDYRTITPLAGWILQLCASNPPMQPRAVLECLIGPPVYEQLASGIQQRVTTSDFDYLAQSACVLAENACILVMGRSQGYCDTPAQYAHAEAALLSRQFEEDGLADYLREVASALAEA